MKSGQLTYTELNRSANRLAQQLRSLGVGPNVMVAICIERSIEMVVGLLAIFKAGGAYVPLDPVYPKERLAFMLADMQPPVLLCQNGQSSTGWRTSQRDVAGGGMAQMTAGQSAENPVSAVDAVTIWHTFCTHRAPLDSRKGY